MKTFNRIVVSLLFAGLVALGVFAVLYSFGLFGYSLTSLSQILGGTVSGIEGLAAAVLAAVALAGVILLIAELRPPRPRKVRLREKETYMTRRAARGERVQGEGKDPPAHRREGEAEGWSEDRRGSGSGKVRRPAAALSGLRERRRPGKQAKALRDRVPRYGVPRYGRGTGSRVN